MFKNICLLVLGMSVSLSALALDPALTTKKRTIDYTCRSETKDTGYVVRVMDGKKNAYVNTVSKRGSQVLASASCALPKPAPGRSHSRSEHKILECRTPGTADQGYDIEIVKKSNWDIVANIKRRTLAGPRPVALNLMCLKWSEQQGQH